MCQGVEGHCNWMQGEHYTTDNLEISTQGSIRVTIKADGTVNFGNIYTYADNNAATTDGLAAGDVYRTSDGTLKIVY